MPIVLPNVVTTDSLQHALAAKDSVLAAVARAAAPDPHPWVQPAIGGALAIVGGFAVQWYRGWREDGRKRELLKRRALTMLGNTVMSARVTLKKDATRRIEPRPWRGLLEDWRRWDRVSDDLDLLPERALADKVEATLGAIRMAAEKVIAEEEGYARSRRDAAMGLAKPETPELIVAQRRLTLALAKGFGDEAQALLVECNQAWPPKPWHQAVGEIPARVDPPDAAPPAATPTAPTP